LSSSYGQVVGSSPRSAPQPDHQQIIRRLLSSRIAAARSPDLTALPEPGNSTRVPPSSRRGQSSERLGDPATRAGRPVGTWPPPRRPGRPRRTPTAQTPQSSQPRSTPSRWCPPVRDLRTRARGRAAARTIPALGGRPRREVPRARGLAVGGRPRRPQHLVNEFATRSRPAAEVGTVFGAEALYTRSTSRRHPRPAGRLPRARDGTLEDLGYGLAGLMPRRWSATAWRARTQYALIDQRPPARLG